MQLSLINTLSAHLDSKTHSTPKTQGATSVNRPGSVRFCGDSYSEWPVLRYSHRGFESSEELRDHMREYFRITSPPNTLLSALIDHLALRTLVFLDRKTDKTTYAVRDSAKRMVAAAWVDKDKSTGSLNIIEFRAMPGYRKDLLGTKIWEQIIDDARSEGFEKISLTVKRPTQETTSRFQDLGFEAGKDNQLHIPLGKAKKTSGEAMTAAEIS